MNVTLYIFPLTKEESQKPQITGFNLILKNQDRLVRADDFDNDNFALNNYD